MRANLLKFLSKKPEVTRKVLGSLRFRLDKSGVPEYRFRVSSVTVPPLVTVCIATYNGAAYLAAQLDSVLNQTHRHLEILIGDDTSSDGTREILKAYAQRDGRIRLIFNPENLGYNRNFEALARQAAGEYIAFCDQDDVWAADKLERLLSAIGENDVAYGTSVLIDANGQPLGGTLLEKLGLTPVQGKGQRALELGNTVSGHARLCRKDFVRRNLPFDTRPPFRLYDYYLAMCANFQRGLVYCQEAVTYHRLHGNNHNHSVKTKQHGKKGLFWQRFVRRRRNLRLAKKALQQIQGRQQLNTVKRAAVFAHYDRDNMVDAYVIEYLRALQAVAETIVFVSDSDLPPDELAKVAPFCAHTIAGRHGEYDFGSYKRGLAFLQPTAGQYDEIILANDSCYCIASFVPVFAAMQHKIADFWGMTENKGIYNVHVQSYFLVFKKSILTNKFFYDFFHNVRAQKNKLAVVKQYEVSLTKELMAQGYRKGVLYNKHNKKDSPLSEQALKRLQRGFPLLKVALLRENPHGVCFLKKWQRFCAPSSIKLIEKHLNRILRGEAFIWDKPKYLQWRFLHKNLFKLELQRLPSANSLVRVKILSLRVLKCVI